MQGIDQNVVGAVPGTRPHRKVAEIDQIADAPGVRRGHAVELGGQTPCPPTAHPGRQPQPRRRDDQRRVGFDGTGVQIHPVVAQWKIARQDERGLADQSVAEAKRRGEVVDLAQSAAGGAVLHPDPHVRRVTVGDVYPERRLGTGPGDDRRRQRPRPVAPILVGKRCRTVVFGIGTDAQRGQYRHHRRILDGFQMADPVVVLGGHPQPMGECGQCRIGHGLHHGG